MKPLPEGEAAFNQLFADYKRNSKIRKISFNLSKKKFKEYTKQTCYYCGVKPIRKVKNTRGFNHGNYVYNGLDRINNRYGYSEKNVVTCCAICNRGKSDMPIEAWTAYMENLTIFRKGVTE